MIVSAAKAQEAAGVLGVELTGLTPDAVGRAYRSKAKSCHPDHHGTAKLEEWSRVSWAKEVLERWAKSHPAEEEAGTAVANTGDCRACGGTGRVKVNKGFSPFTMQCVMCNGLGSLSEEKPDE